jgi:hypothetical protein
MMCNAERVDRKRVERGETPKISKRRNSRGKVMEVSIVITLRRNSR